MTYNEEIPTFGPWRISIAVLALLSFSSLVLSAWLLLDVRHEQAVVAEFTEHLPQQDRAEANELAQELLQQSRLAVLLTINLLGSGIALALLVRGYFRNEQQLRKVRIQAEDILASLNHGVITANQEGRLLSLNPKAYEFLGLQADESPPLLSELADGHKCLEEMRRDLLAGQSVPEVQYSIERDFHRRYYRVDCSHLRDHDKKPVGIVLHLRDVTETNLMQERLLRMERYIGLASLAAGLQHEIKNPLSALALHVQLLKESLASRPPDVSIQESLEVLSTEIRRITRVLANFRDFASDQKLNLGPIDVQALLERLVKLTSIEATQRGIGIELKAEPGTNSRLMGDGVKLEQTFLNLVINAFDSMPVGGRLRIELGSAADRLWLKFSDTGKGIPKEWQDKVFDPYFTTKPAGTGMGLAICDKIIRQHNGSIDFVSGREGTTFLIELPRNGN